MLNTSRTTIDTSHVHRNTLAKSKTAPNKPLLAPSNICTQSDAITWPQSPFPSAPSLTPPAASNTVGVSTPRSQHTSRIGRLERVGDKQQATIEFALHAPKQMALHEALSSSCTPLIVLVSGLNTSKEWTHPAFVDLCKEYGIVLCPDNRGVGGSIHKGPSSSSTQSLYVKNYIQSTLTEFKREHPWFFWGGAAATAITASCGAFAYPVAGALAASATALGLLAASNIAPAMTIEDMADDTHTIVKKLKLDNHPLLLIGVSMGSMIAQELASGDDPPANLKGLALLFPGFGPMIGKKMPTIDFLLKMGEIGEDDTGRDFLELLCSEEQKAQHIDNESQFVQHTRKALKEKHTPDPHAKSLQTGAIFNAHDRRANLSKLLETTPVLAIAGKEDLLIPASNLNDFQDYIKQNASKSAQSNLYATTVDGLGHWITRSGRDLEIVLRDLNHFLYEYLGKSLKTSKTEELILRTVLKKNEISSTQ